MGWGLVVEVGWRTEFMRTMLHHLLGGSLVHASVSSFRTVAALIDKEYSHHGGNGTEIEHAFLAVHQQWSYQEIVNEEQ
jgi:hypothetical protein